MFKFGFRLWNLKTENAVGTVGTETTLDWRKVVHLMKETTTGTGRESTTKRLGDGHLGMVSASDGNDLTQESAVMNATVIEETNTLKISCNVAVVPWYK